nr:fucoidan sulfatase [Luteolibacter algae]
MKDKTTLSDPSECHLLDGTTSRRRFLISTGTFVAGLAAGSAFAADPRIVSLKDAHKGSLEIDLRIMNQYETQPQEVQDFYVACREALTGPDPDTALAGVCKKFGRNKVGGPLLGDLTTTSVAVWVNLPEADKIDVEVTPKAGGSAAKYSSKDTERFHSVLCEGLSPDTHYVYRISDSQGRDLGGGEFATAPEALSEKPFKIAFGTCYHKVGMYRPELMKLIRERNNRSMLVLGDSAVDGRRDDFGLIQSDYLLRNLSPHWQRLAAHVPVSATWDDHDYYGDDTSGTLTNGKKPINVDGLRQAWRKNWNNPERDVEREGIYFSTRIGPVQHIALDTRSCRVNLERGKLNSFLGAEQMTWLKEQIAESTAPFILLSSGTMWTDYISDGKDSWGTWDTEGREEIFQAIDAKADTKVILLSGDRHGARGFAIPRPGGKKIYEFEAATLGGVPGPGPFGEDRSAQLFGLPSNSWAFGEFTFRSSNGAPEATFRLLNERGEELETIPLV